MRANFLFEKRVLSELALFVCSFYTRHFLSLEEPGLSFNMDETDSIVFRRSVYLFNVPFTYSVSEQTLLTKLLTVCNTKLLHT